MKLINLGTGTKLNDVEVHRSGGLANLMPTPFRMALSLKSALKNIAVDSEVTAGVMKTLAATCNGFKYARFSADNKVGLIGLDKCQKLEEIERLTSEYLEKPLIAQKMEQLAEDIAKDYFANEAALDHLQSTLLSVPDRSAVRPQTPVSQTGSKSRQSIDTQPSTEQSRNVSEISAQDTPSKAQNSAMTEATTPSSSMRRHDK